MQSAFLWTTCQVGAENTLKNEITREHPELKFAYSRPGFVTFKNGKAPMSSDFHLHSVFARAYGLSLQKVALPATAPLPLGQAIGEIVKKTITEIRASATANPASNSSLLQLHLVERDRFAPGETPPQHDENAFERTTLPGIQAQLEGIADLPPWNQTPSLGDVVITVVLVESNEAWIGVHLHAPPHSPLPGGKARIALPPQAPSRAYLKMEESLLWSQAPLAPGDVAVELGSAPGGSCYALLERGLQVIGMDSAAMSPTVLNHPRYRHIGHSTANFDRREFPAQVHWLAMDMNISPDFSLKILEAVSPAFRSSLLGGLLTFKLNNWGYAASVPALIERIKELGFIRVRATQLASNRQEIFIFGLTRLGTQRIHKAATQSPGTMS